jgi:hypothetical protein
MGFIRRQADLIAAIAATSKRQRHRSTINEAVVTQNHHEAAREM